MKYLFLDRYTHKIIVLGESSDLPYQCGEKIVYTTLDQKTQLQKESIAVFVKTVDQLCDEERKLQEGEYCRRLQGDELDQFLQEQKDAQEDFLIFKEAFKSEFPTAIPVTARFQIFSHQLFLYFYSEERFVFTEFVKRLRGIFKKNVFLFQVGARDMVRLSPATDHLFCGGDVKLCCKQHMIFQNVEIEKVLLQNLEGRDIERLKGRCGKLKCCLLYEMNIYLEESKKYPQKGSTITLDSHLVCKNETCENKEVCEGIVLSYNIMNQEIKIKTKEGLIRLTLDKLN